MKVLVIGSGGREHAIVWKLSQSPRISKIYAAPGNPGMAELAQCIGIGDEGISAIAHWAQENHIDLTVVGPDAYLAMGTVDEFEKRGLRVFGPNKAAAEIEASKVFSKNLMKKYGIPTARYEVFNDLQSAAEYVDKHGAPVVIKADGLAAGKGAIVCMDKGEATMALETIMGEKVFGEAGDKVVVEEFMTGVEASLLAFCDGRNVVPMVSAQDHKRAYDNDMGPNTGGMGTYSPVPFVTPEVVGRVMAEIVKPAVEAMAAEGRPFKGVLYTGLMLTESGPKVVEFNSRFGDPEAQVILPRLKTDLVDICEAVIDGKLGDIEVEWDDRAAACVVMASQGYPGHYENGKPICGIDAAAEKGIIVFQAGTGFDDDGRLVTAGGRVLNVVALGDSLPSAIGKAYEGVSYISFEGAQFRHDIGKKALDALASVQV